MMRSVFLNDVKIRDSSKANRLIAILAGILFVVSIIPIIWMIPFNYASAEDMNFGASVHRAIMDGGNASYVFRTALIQAGETYNTWQGTWFCNFVHQFEPSVFNEKAYVIVPVFAIALVLLSHYVFLKTILVDIFEIDTNTFYTVFFIFSFFLFQFIISPKYGYFFYIGVIAYTLPVILAILVTTMLIRYLLYEHIGMLLWTIPLVVMVGGCGYPPAVLLLTVFLLCAARILFSSSKKRMLFLLMPFIPFLVSLYISVIAPGNHARGGSNLHVGFRELFIVLARSLKAGLLGEYRETSFYYYIRPLFILVVALFIISFYAFDPHRCKYPIENPIIALFVHVAIVSCVHAPEELINLVAKESNEATGFSSGVYNAYYFVFMLSTTVLCMYIGAWAKTILLKYMPSSKLIDSKWFEQHIMIGFALFVVMFCLVMGKHLVGNTVDYLCINYIKSGALMDYDYQMRERIALLSDDTCSDVIVPQMNYDQGPFQHFSLSEYDKDAWANVCTARFYNKQSVLAMDRVTFYGQYGYVLEDENSSEP